MAKPRKTRSKALTDVGLSFLLGLPALEGFEGNQKGKKPLRQVGGSPTPTKLPTPSSDSKPCGIRVAQEPAVHL